MNTIKSAVAFAAVAISLAVSGCASLQSADSNDILASMAHDSPFNGEIRLAAASSSSASRPLPLARWSRGS